MTDLFLIAHKVRGEPAFDIASRMACPECQSELGCHECDGTGFWWVIPTSGHRAYPYWYLPLIDLFAYTNVGDPPPSLPDHYHLTVTPSRTNPLDAILPKAPPRTIVRRI